jgi:hypothetical protein
MIAYRTAGSILAASSVSTIEQSSRLDRVPIPPNLKIPKFRRPLVDMCQRTFGLKAFAGDLATARIYMEFL